MSELVGNYRNKRNAKEAKNILAFENQLITKNKK